MNQENQNATDTGIVLVEGMLLTSQQTAQALGVALTTLQAWRSKRVKLKFFKIGNRSIRYRSDDVIALLNENAREVA
jgi:predicted site-specific integrase-resolvase